ncbi:pentapeptide repeat-containing protein [uncultured Actinomyces sp.]|jgi:hypothetical protein|uniref:pentapeptide repeat-containing protein n=1 Tax=uncultured Actinomyces sp. TaxID=249061 RepID=UPI00260FA853|nr:pentapeptide repeat-containing protein [uncultured Actinomyces sp.]
MEGTGLKSVKEMAAIRGLRVRENNFPDMDREILGSAGRVRAVGADWSRLDLDKFSVWKSVFEGCDFSGSRIGLFGIGGGASFSEYRGCNFNGLRGAMMASGRAHFVGCSFRGAHIKGINSSTMSLVDCDFSGAVLKDCVFWGSPLRSDLKNGSTLPAVNEFKGNDFSTADLVSCSFRYGVDLDAQRLPEADYYARVRHAPTALEHGREVVKSWAGLVECRVGERILDAIEREIQTYQFDQFFDSRPYEFTDISLWRHLKKVLEQA